MTSILVKLLIYYHGIEMISLQQVQELHVMKCNSSIFPFRYIDGGRNPQLYTKDCMEKALTKNEQVR